MIAGIARVQALLQAQASAETALKATEAGYEVGTRTAVDVLNARRTLVQAQSDYAASRYDYIVSVLQLREAAGTLDRAQLTEINKWLTVESRKRPEAITPETVAPTMPKNVRRRGHRARWPHPAPPERAPEHRRRPAGRTATGNAPRTPRQRQALRPGTASSGSISASSLPSAPRLPSTHSRRRRADARPRLRVGDETRDACGELLAVVHHLGGALRDEEPRDLRAVEVVRAGEDRHAEGSGLEQVVAAHRDEAATDEGDVGRRVEVQQLPERIEQQHVASSGVRVRQRAAREATPDCAQRLRRLPRSAADGVAPSPATPAAPARAAAARCR